MSIAKGFPFMATQTGLEFGCNAMQFFTKSPRSRSHKPIDPIEAAEFKKLCQQYNIKYVIAHSSYLLNFGQKMENIPWAIKDLTLDFERLALLGGHGIVVHIGKSLQGDRSSAIHNVIENAKIILDHTEHLTTEEGKPLQYILENTAGQGSEIGFELQELGQILKELRNFNPRLKSCLDTAHIWAAGYDISTAAGSQKLLKTYDELIGLDTLSCFHFNDSKKALGSRVDRHENIGAGLISANPGSLEGLKTIATFAEKNSIPLILETPEKDGKTHADDIKIVKNFF